MREDDIFNGIGVEVDLPMYENFLKVKETLTRIGTLDGTAKLKQSCYLLHKRGRYVVAHVHELQWLDGLNVTPSTEDIAIRNRIAVLLESWKLVHIAEEGAGGPPPPLSPGKGRRARRSPSRPCPWSRSSRTATKRTGNS